MTGAKMEGRSRGKKEERGNEKEGVCFKEEEGEKGKMEKEVLEREKEKRNKKWRR